MVERTKGETQIPVTKVKGGYRWGKTGKIFKLKWMAERQGRAIEASKNSPKRLKREVKPR